MPGPAGLKAASVRCACQSTHAWARRRAKARSRRAWTGLAEAPDGCDMRMSIMTTFPGPRSSAEIRAYLKTRLNQALRRPGMFGGEWVLGICGPTSLIKQPARRR